MGHSYKSLAWLLAGLVGAQAVQAGMAQLRVSTLPEGAMVSCDGILYDASPVAIGNLEPGDHLISVEKPGFVPARRTVSLDAGQKAAVDVKLDPITGLILVRSTPDGAEIKVDGADRGKTPLLLTDLPVGRYRLTATAAGFVAKDIELTVENRTPQGVTVNLASDSAKLIVNSKPQGATVVVNGLTKGTTPCDIDRLPAGDNAVSITLADYVPFQQKVKLQAGDVQKIDATLSPQPASLSVISTPMGAKVFVDDVLMGQSPVVLNTIVPGTHAIRAELAGYETGTRSVDLKNRDRRVEEFQLVRNAGTLDVMTDQPGVKIMVDGAVKGTILAAGDKPSEPLKVELSVGEHTLSLSKKGYSSVERTISIKKGEVLTVREMMKRNFVPDTSIRLNSGEIAVGCLSRKLPNGDVELETQIGIFKTLKADEILSMEPIGPSEKK